VDKDYITAKCQLDFSLRDLIKEKKYFGETEGKIFNFYSYWRRFQYLTVFSYLVKKDGLVFDFVQM